MPEPGSPEWRERLASLLNEEANCPLGLWYLSFAEPGKFLGGVFIEASGFVSAHLLSVQLGINPGGKVAGWKVPAENVATIPGSMRNRLLSRVEMEAAGQ